MTTGVAFLWGSTTSPGCLPWRWYLPFCMPGASSAAGIQGIRRTPRVGASVVNALSEWLEVTIYSEGKIYRQRYERGQVVYKLKVIGDCPEDKTGTMVTFLPDKEIFEETVFEYDTLKQRLREMAFLTKI